MRKSVLFFILAAMILPAVLAGTLKSGSTVDVRSNYQGFSGLTLVGTWSTTPAASDILLINNALLPEPYGIQKEVKITVAQPKFEQVLKITDQTPIYTVQFVERHYWIWNLPFGKTKEELCQESFQQNLQDEFNGRTLLPGTGAVAIISNGDCYVQFVLLNAQNGWVGKADTSRFFYDQTINLDGIGTLHLVRNDKQDQLSDSLSGIGKATLLNFGLWTNAQLSDNNVYGYHNKNTLGTDIWRPFNPGSRITTYETTLAQMKAEMGNTGGFFKSYLVDASRMNALVSTLNGQSEQIRGVAYSLPSSWEGRVDGSVRTVGNEIVVPIRRNTLTADIQLILAGEKFGLYIPTGKPKIISADASIKFDETASGYLKYKVQNVGTDTGTFSLQGFCGGSKVSVEEEEFSLKAGEIASGTLLMTAKSNSFAKTEDVSCHVDFQETSTHEKVSRDFTVTIIVKDSCAEGEETDPKLYSGEMRVDVLDAHCNVKDTKVCPIAGKEFKKLDGVWTCVDKDGIETSPPKPDAGFNKNLFIIAVILGVIAAGIIGSVTYQKFNSSGSTGKAIWIILMIVVFVGVLFVVSYLASAAVSLFTIKGLV